MWEIPHFSVELYCYANAMNPTQPPLVIKIVGTQEQIDSLYKLPGVNQFLEEVNRDADIRHVIVSVVTESEQSD